MNAPEPAPLLEQFLRALPRRYRLPDAVTNGLSPVDAPPANVAASRLASAIEKARQARATGAVPPPELEHTFVDALATLIHDALMEDGDPAFQAMVLKHEEPRVREYASLAASAEQDRRRILGLVNSLAHPAKLERAAPDSPQDARLHTLLRQLFDAAVTGDWSATARHAGLLADAGVEQASVLAQDPALNRLQAAAQLHELAVVVQYRALWEKNGPRAGSTVAVENGSASRQRGDAVETLATEAMQVLAEWLNVNEGAHAEYRVVSSMRVPSSIPASPDRAKSEWDAVLLRRPLQNGSAAWDISLLVEAKASADAAPGDLARLLRGLRLLAHADPSHDYAFPSRQGLVHLRGASLSTLSTDEESVRRFVLYCCDTAADVSPRLLSAGSRMQLLSAPASLEYAAALGAARHAQAPVAHADPQMLKAVWQEILHAPQWRGVFHQYATLRQVRELMVHPEDLLATAQSMG